MWMDLIWLTERKKFAKWLIKQNSTLCCTEETILKHKNPKRLKTKECTHLWGKWKQQENREWDPDTGVDFKPKSTKWDKGHIPTHTAVINIYVLANTAIMYLKQTAWNARINRNTLILGNLKIPLRMRLAKWTKNRRGGKSSKLHNQ